MQETYHKLQAKAS